MKVEIWSDFMCPFCYIGSSRLQKAVKNVTDPIEIEFRTFQLFPDMRGLEEKSLDEAIADIKGIDVSEIAGIHQKLKAVGHEEGLEFDFSRLSPVNSLDALRLVHLSKANGCQQEFVNAVFKSFFTDGQDIGDHSILTEIGVKIGLKKEAVMEVLDGSAYLEEVYKDQSVGSQIGVKSVPFYVFNNHFALSGAHSIEIFEEVLKKAREEYVEDCNVRKCSDCNCDRFG